MRCEICMIDAYTSFAKLNNIAMSQLFEVTKRTQRAVIKLVSKHTGFNEENSDGLLIGSDFISRINLASVLMKTGMRVLTVDNMDMETTVYIDFAMDMSVAPAVPANIFLILMYHRIDALFEVLDIAGYDLGALYVELTSEDVAKFLSYTFNSFIGCYAERQYEVQPFVMGDDITLETDTEKIAERFTSEALSRFSFTDAAYEDIKGYTSVMEDSYQSLGEPWRRDTYMKAYRKRIATEYLEMAGTWLASVYPVSGGKNDVK